MFRCYKIWMPLGRISLWQERAEWFSNYALLKLSYAPESLKLSFFCFFFCFLFSFFFCFLFHYFFLFRPFFLIFFNFLLFFLYFLRLFHLSNFYSVFASCIKVRTVINKKLYPSCSKVHFTFPMIHGCLSPDHFLQDHWHGFATTALPVPISILIMSPVFIGSWITCLSEQGRTSAFTTNIGIRCFQGHKMRTSASGEWVHH